MCARFIVDRNVLFAVMPEKPRPKRDSGKSQPERDPGFFEWYKNGHGLLCYTEEIYPKEEARTKGKPYAEENKDQMKLLRKYKEAGRAHVAAKQQMREARAQLRRSSFKIGSDDRYVLALSLATEATILCSRDKGLQNDFRNLNIDGKTRKTYPVSPQKVPPGSEEQIEFLARNRCKRASPAS